MNMKDVLHRVGEIIGSQKNCDIADEFKVEPNVCSNWKTRGTIPWLKLFNFCNKKSISFDWLLTGHEEASKSPPEWTFDEKVRLRYTFLTKVVAEANEEAKAGYSADTLCRNIIKDMEKQLIKIEDDLKKTNWCLK